MSTPPENGHESSKSENREKKNKTKQQALPKSPKHVLTDEMKLEYQTKGRESWDRAWEILHTTTGWKDGGGTDEQTTGKVFYQNFPDIGRVFKLEGIIPFPKERLFDEVVGKVELNPKWNPTVLESKIVESVDENTDICHNITAEAAGGLVASRDFVSVRHWKTKDGIILSAGMAVQHPDCPQSKKYVRGLNKPGGWFFQPHRSDPGLCNFGWLMAVDLRGWLPQAIIDQAVPSTLLDFNKYLKVRVENIKMASQEGTR